MNVKKFGKTGVLVSELCLGTMTFGWQTNEDAAFKIMTSFNEEKGNFIDTANVYSSGHSEQIVGKWLAANNREEMFVATKVRFRTADHPNGVGLSRKHILYSIRQSLQRLNTDYVDLLQIHAWDPLTPLEETLRTLNTIVEDGLVRYIGVSNFRAWQFEKALQICRANGWNEPVSLQPNYNLLTRAVEFELLPMAHADEIAVLPWSPLAGGILSGKYRNGIMNAPKGTRIGDSSAPENYSRFDNERTERVLSVLEKISQETGKSIPQISLNWLLCNRDITSPIIGVRTIDQLEDNLGSTDWSLNETQIRELNNASELAVTYPYDQRAEDQQTRDRIL